MGGVGFLFFVQIRVGKVVSYRDTCISSGPTNETDYGGASIFQVILYNSLNILRQINLLNICKTLKGIPNFQNQLFLNKPELPICITIKVSS